LIKLALRVRLEVIVISLGFSVDPSDHSLNRYMPSGVAVTVILDPSLYVPPGELTAPPVSAVIVSVYLLGAGGVTTSSSIEQEASASSASKV